MLASLKLGNFSDLRKVLVFVFLIGIFVSLGSQSAFGNSYNTEKINGNDTVRKTLVISVPRTTWELLGDANTPSIDSLVSKGTVAGLSVRSRKATTSPSEAYASLGSGNRAEAFGSQSSTFLAPEEIWEGSPANEVFQKQRGGLLQESVAGLSLGYELNVSANKNSFYQSKLGSLQSELKKNDKSIAVFGNADKCNNDEAGCFDRSLGFFGANSEGILENGEISRDLLKVSESDTTEISLDLKQVISKVKNSLKEHDVTLVECSDLERLEAFKSSSKEEIYEKLFRKALESCDKMVGSILESVSLRQDRVYLLSPTSTSGLNQTTVFIAAGKSIPVGYATSASTRHVGSVTIVDLAPSILNSYGIEIPEDMGQTLFDWKESSDSDSVRINSLIKMNDEALAREKAIKPVTLALVIISVTSILLSIVALTKSKKWNLFAKWAALLCSFYPTFTYILKPFYLDLAIPLGLIALTLLLCTIGAGISYLIYKKHGILWAILTVGIFNLSVHAVDVLFGGNLQFNSAFGHSPIVAGRFSGFSNQAFAIISISMVLIVAMVVELNKEKSLQQRKPINFALLLFMILVLIIDGAPFFGSDVGGVLALVPTIFVVSILLFEKRVSIKWLFIAGVVTVVTLTGFALLDLARPVSQRSHLGRFAQSVVIGDAGVTIERKLAASLRTFQSSSWVIIVISFLVFCAYVFFKERDVFLRLCKENLGFKIFVYSGALVAFLGMGLNDSGVSIPSMMMVISMVPLTFYLVDNKV